MMPASGAPEPRTLRAVSVAALNLTPTPEGGYTTTPLSGNDALALTGTDIANLLQRCGLLKQPPGGAVPITYVSLTPVPGGNAVPQVTSGYGPSAQARDALPGTPASGYGNAGFAGNLPQPRREAMPSTAQCYGSSAPWAKEGRMPQYGPDANSSRGAYGYSPYRDNGAVPSQYRRETASPTGYGGAYGNSSRSPDGYNAFPGTRRDQMPTTDYSSYGQFDGNVTIRPNSGNPPYSPAFDDRLDPIDIDVERRPANNGSPKQYNVSVRGMPRRTLAARRMSCGAPATRSRRSMSPPPRDRSPSPVPGDEGEPAVGAGPGPTSRRNVVSSHSRGRAAGRGSGREQEMAREALDEAQGILATVREQMETRDDFRQRMGARDLERFKAAVLQLERALDVQKTQPNRRCRSPPVQ